jgi:hypothetical protein
MVSDTPSPRADETMGREKTPDLKYVLLLRSAHCTLLYRTYNLALAEVRRSLVGKLPSMEMTGKMTVVIVTATERTVTVGATHMRKT